MKSLLLVVSFLALSLAAQAKENVTGRVTITFSPDSANGGVVETDLRQVGNKILGQSSMLSNGFINLQVENGTYAGVTGVSSLTNLKCDTNGCTGFINGFGVNLTNKTVQKKGVSYMETGGTVNNNVYTADYNDNSLQIFSWNSIDLKKQSDGSFAGQANIGMGIYDVTIKADGTLQNFVSDPALVAIFLGAVISHQ